MNSDDNRFVPPYGISWDTFRNTIEKLETEGIPNRIDRSYLSNLSGNVQTYLMAALKSFGLTGENGEAEKKLGVLVEAGDSRPAAMAELLREYYGAAIKLGQTSATQAELEELWNQEYGQAGDTRRKAIRFFLAAATYSGITLSKLWKAPRASTGSAVPRKARAAKKSAGQNGNDAGRFTPPKAAQSLRQFVLRSGRTLTLTLDGDVLALDRTERKFVMDIVDQIEEHVEKHPQTAAPKAPKASPEGGGEGASA